MARFLKTADVADLLDLKAAVACLTRAFDAQARDGIGTWAPNTARTGRASLFLRAGGLIEEGFMGIRVTTGPTTPSYALIYSTATGQLEAFLSYPFSDLRLHAAVAIGIDHLAKPGASQVAMIGSGRNALGLLESACAVRPVTEVLVYSPNQEHREAFAAKASRELGVVVRPVTDPRAAVEPAEVVITATSSAQPAVQGAWLRRDAHVTSMGSRAELDDDVYLRAERIVTNAKVHELSVHDAQPWWPLIRLPREGRLNWDEIVELGQLTTGVVARPNGISVFRESRGGFDDVALALYLYQRASELGRGTDWFPE
jgi:ornithine cyclodeaminase/alanine dehydrogenase-like protein (mu-crystallin family)